MATAGTYELQLELAADGDAAELADMTAMLRRELLQLDVQSVDAPPEDDLPPGAKAAGVLALGALVVTLIKGATPLAMVVRATQGWLSGSNRTVKLELDGDSIEVSGVSSKNQQRLIDAWIERHAEPA